MQFACLSELTARMNSYLLIKLSSYINMLTLSAWFLNMNNQHINAFSLQVFGKKEQYWLHYLCYFLQRDLNKTRVSANLNVCVKLDVKIGFERNTSLVWTYKRIFSTWAKATLKKWHQLMKYNCQKPVGLFVRSTWVCFKILSDLADSDCVCTVIYTNVHSDKDMKPEK